ncbi:MAG: hypothetical protein EFT35_01240 [Methanophagales archaeon ANME-1-THS]|nr:MAG: hypothetical protein EFT35_01240 [Methanophagales archaeon ANME-1-THS]
MKKIARAGLLLLLLGVTIGSIVVPVSATSVDRLSITDNEGYAGDVIEILITLESTADAARTGHWRTYYKAVEGDDEKMDITSWIEVIPTEYTLNVGETKEFTVRITIPENAKPGLYGAIAENAGMEGHSGDRRTYIIFEDADSAALSGGGSAVYSGLLIPVSVNVLPEQNPLIPIIRGIQENVVYIALVAVIIVLLVLLLRRKK